MSKLLNIAVREYGVSEYAGKQMSDYHTVNKGENLTKIGLRYGVTSDFLMKLNSLSSDTIYIGQQLRVSERRLPVSNPRIVRYAQEAGFSSVKTDQEAWCGIFICWLCHKLGIPHTNSASARSWLKMGRVVQFITSADLAVFWREDPNSNFGHVGIPLSYSEDKKMIHVLGGNQSNMVCVKPYEADRLLAFIQL